MQPPWHLPEAVLRLLRAGLLQPSQRRLEHRGTEPRERMDQRRVDDLLRSAVVQQAEQGFDRLGRAELPEKLHGVDGCVALARRVLAVQPGVSDDREERTDGRTARGEDMLA